MATPSSDTPTTDSVRTGGRRGGLVVYVESGRIRDLRRRKLLTQQELADRCGIRRPTITGLEATGAKAEMSTIEQLAAALGVRPERLVKGPA